MGGPGGLGPTEGAGVHPRDPGGGSDGVAGPGEVGAEDGRRRGTRLPQRVRRPIKGSSWRGTP